MGAVYYNEHDANAAAWLRELIARGLIAPGDVDERSIADVSADEVRGFTQCHFFAGIGVWSYALRSAGWPDDAPVWTGSCPCQPFSASGKRGGTDDTRHLWPAWFRLIRECRPDVCFGEQVASKDGLAWLDFVCADMEDAGYAIGAVDTCAAGVGAPHIRQRLYFVAEPQRAERWAHAERGTDDHATVGVGPQDPSGTRERGTTGIVADAGHARRNGGRNRQEPNTDVVPPGANCGMADACTGGLGIDGRPSGEDGRHSDKCRPASVVADAGRERRQQEARGASRHETANGRARRNGGEPHGHHIAGSNGADGVVGDADGPHESAERLQRGGEFGRAAEDAGTGATAGFWRDAEWIPCRDGKARPIEPGTFPLAHGAPARVVRLRGYGNAIVAPQAQAFIEAYLDVRG